MANVRIENWSVVHKDPYYPESDRRLRGRVFGHPRFPDGEVVTTSPIVSASGLVVTTRSGTPYELGEPEEDYREWVRREFGKEIDPDAPVKLLD